MFIKLGLIIRYVQRPNTKSTSLSSCLVFVQTRTRLRKGSGKGQDIEDKRKEKYIDK